MHHAPRFVASRAAGALHFEHCDVPIDMTLDEWRRSCAAERRDAESGPRSGPMVRGLRRLLGA